MLNQKLQQKLLQKLSPQQIQLIKLLEIPTIQLEQRIKREIEENPVLEEGGEDMDDNTRSTDDYSSDHDTDDDSLDGPEYDEPERDINDDYNDDEFKKTQSDEEFTVEDYLEDDDTPNYRLNSNNYSDDDDDRRSDIPYSSGNSLHEYLLSQLGLGVMNEDEQLLAEYIIGNIDEDGYLRRDIENIVDDIAFTAGYETTEKELLKILTIIQDFDPAGVGARDLRECLMLQVMRNYRSQKGDKTILKFEYLILKEFFEEFSKKHYDKILSKTDITEKQLKQAVEDITRLNPKPGSIFAPQLSKSTQHIIPDFILEDHDGDFILHLNSKNVPELRINRTYADMIDSAGKSKGNKKDKETLLFVKQKLDSAKWFIEAIKQRQNTLMITMQAILDYQKEYFEDGDETKLKPMILKTIADATGFDISTISRVANSKYIQTHFGIFPLKFFFSEGMQTTDGDEVSTREIKKILKECIDNESKRQPLTDEKLAKILQQRGYQIARRTVAKYREQMNILVARLRKEL